LNYLRRAYLSEIQDALAYLFINPETAKSLRTDGCFLCAALLAPQRKDLNLYLPDDAMSRFIWNIGKGYVFLVQGVLHP